VTTTCRFYNESYRPIDHKDHPHGVPCNFAALCTIVALEPAISLRENGTGDGDANMSSNLSMWSSGNGTVNFSRWVDHLHRPAPDEAEHHEKPHEVAATGRVSLLRNYAVAISYDFGAERITLTAVVASGIYHNRHFNVLYSDDRRSWFDGGARERRRRRRGQ